MKMMKVEYIPAPANGKTIVKPGGYHLMIFGLKKKLNIGDKLPLTLIFEQAGEISVTAEISKKSLVLSGQKMDHKMNEKKH